MNLRKDWIWTPRHILQTGRPQFKLLRSTAECRAQLRGFSFSQRLDPSNLTSIGIVIGGVVDKTVLMALTPLHESLGQRIAKAWNTHYALVADIRSCVDAIRRKRCKLCVSYTFDARTRQIKAFQVRAELPVTALVSVLLNLAAFLIPKRRISLFCLD
jgi:hypothetical protein